MNNINFTDEFTKSIAWLLTAYETAPFLLNEDDFMSYMTEFVENGVEIYNAIGCNTNQLKYLRNYYDAFQKDYVHKKEDFISSKSYLFSIFLGLFCFKKCKEEFKDSLSLNMLNEMITLSDFLNVFIGSLLQEYDFENFGKLDFNSAYQPNIDMRDYMYNIYKTEASIEKYELVYGLKNKILLDEDLVKVNHKLDCEFIDMGYSFMQIQATLLLLEHSDFYKSHVQEIAREIILLFKDLLVDTRIKKVIIDNALLKGVHRLGIKKTTCIKIFFALGNMDRYCLRIDFPHDDKTFMHYNLHEPNRETAMPIDQKQYQQIVDKYGEQKDLFFYFSKRYWFRYDFMNKLTSKYSSEDNSAIRSELVCLFEKQAHLHTFKNNYSNQEITDFIVAFSTAMSHMQNSSLEYGMTDSEDIQEELKKIKLRDILLNAIELFQRITIEEKLFNKDYFDLKEELRKNYLHSISDFYRENAMPAGTLEELQELDIKDIFIFVEMLSE